MKRTALIVCTLASMAASLAFWVIGSPSNPSREQSVNLTSTGGANENTRSLQSRQTLDSAHASQSGGQHAMAPSGSSDLPPLVEPGVKYGRLADQPLPDTLKDRLRAELQRLKDTGSGSGGKVTHEFAGVEHPAGQLRERGQVNLLGALAITPANLAQALGDGFELVGADASGKEIPGRGRAAYYQVWRNSANKWVELAEDQLDVLGGDGAVVHIDFHNEKVDSHPASLETLVEHEGARLYNLQWWVKDRSLFMTTRNLGKEEVIVVATRISRQVEALPNEGWREPYAFDLENPAHRLVRSRQQTRPSVKGVVP